MTTEEKDLLRKDLCARFPYGVIVSVTDGTIKFNAYIESVSYKNIQVSPVSDSNFTAYTFYKISDVKPYLRPMSSMTEEEAIEFIKLTDSIIKFVNRHYAVLSLQQIDWLNAHHFDYRGLIDKSLALEAPEGMYK